MSGIELYREALAACGRAHAPYSGLRVGAVVEDEHGRLHPGGNLELSSYGLTICAERAALSRAVGEGARRVARVAVALEGALPIAPCGACRQSLADFGLDALVVYRSAEGLVERCLRDLLPDAFSLP